jgi:hypothetical protein
MNVPVTTQHNDTRRTGANLAEKRLTPARVHGLGGWHMRLRTWHPLDGQVSSQALYVPFVAVHGGLHNVIYVQTQKNYVDAYDAEDTTNPGTTAGLLWSTQLPAVTDPSRPYASGSSIGTPVIDRSTSTMYLVYGVDNGAFPSNGVGDSGYSVAFHLAALDIRSGAILRDSLIQAQVPSTVAPGHADFAAQRQIQRAGLLLSQGTIYVAFASRWREETTNWHGWVMRYDAATFRLVAAFCSTPDRRDVSEGGGIWEGGGGLPADDSGNVFFLTGNGPAGTNSYGNSIVRLTPTAGGFTVAGFSAAADDPAHATQWANDDIDLGAGGSMLVPHTSSLIGGGKTGVYYVMNTNGGLTKVQSYAAFTNRYDPSGRYTDWQSGPHLHGDPTYWAVSHDSGFVYSWAEKDSLRRFTYHTATGTLDTTSGVAAPILANNYIMPGGEISLSANRTHDGILWVTHPLTATTGEVVAFDARSLQILWQDSITVPANFVPPTVSNGLVIVPTADGNLWIYDLVRTALHLPPVPRLGPVPWYLIPLGDPAPRVETTLGELAPEIAARLRPPAEEKMKLLFTAALSGTTLIDDLGLHPGMGYRGRGETLGTFAENTLRTSDGQALSATVVETAPNGWQLLRVERHETTGLFARVGYIQRLGKLIAFWGRL